MSRRKIATYLDADILIAASQGKGDIALQAIEVLDDPDRAFVASAFLKLEILPKPRFNEKAAEVSFYEEYFSKVATWVEIDNNLIDKAIDEAGRTDMSALDALHVVSAATAHADQFITGEKTGKPVHRTTLVQVKSLRSLQDR